MPLEIKKLNPENSTVTVVTAKERLWLTQDRDRLVGDGDPEARFLFCAPGHRIPAAEARKYGLIESEVKEAAPAETKEMPKSENKGRGR